MGAWRRFATPVQRHFRQRRSGLYTAVLPDFAGLRVCDVGGSRHFWEAMPPELAPADLTLLNIVDDAQSASHQGRYAALEVQVYDGQHIPFADGHFDAVVCNSVLEHVPPAQRLQLAQEIRRVARYYFVQTPAHEFPVEPHFVAPFLHWLPRRLGRRLVRFGLWSLLARPTQERRRSYFDEVQLLRRREVCALFPGAHLEVERVLGLPKSWTAHGPGRVAGTRETEHATERATA